MVSRAIRWSELPGATPLFCDYLSGSAQARAIYGRWFGDGAAFRQAAAEIDFPADRRRALVEALAAQNGPHPSLDQLVQPGTLVVATGQQVGLFTGPAYTIYKALTAVKLARRLSDSGLPAVPIFWLASEDHDFDEAGHCWVFNSAQQPVLIEAPARLPSQAPVGLTRVEPALVEELRRALDGLPFADYAVQLVRETYQPGATFSIAFRELLKRMLPSSGLLYLDPLDPSIRALAAPLLAQAATRSRELVRLVLSRNQQLEAAGYHAQVHVDSESTLLFLLDNGLRLPLRASGEAFRCDGRPLPLEGLTGRAQDLSPNALLRPVMQDYILPTVASVVGPAEVAYLAQARVVYDSLLGRMPVLVPRAGFTVLDASVAHLIERYGLSLKDLFAGEERLREKIASRLVPPALTESLAQTRGQIEEALERLRAGLAFFDPTLAESLERRRQKILYHLHTLERKTSNEALRRDERAALHASRLSALTTPRGYLQERFYSFLALAARHGPGLADMLYAGLDLDSGDHLVVIP